MMIRLLLLPCLLLPLAATAWTAEVAKPLAITIIPLEKLPAPVKATVLAQVEVLKAAGTPKLTGVIFNGLKYYAEIVVDGKKPWTAIVATDGTLKERHEARVPSLHGE